MNDSIPLKSILLVAANPKGTASLRLQEEEREIRERLRLAGYGKVPINSTGATRPRDIQQAMVDFKPQIVHFSGHGVGQDGLAFEDVSGQLKLVDSEALAILFKLFSNHIECVVLNACYSKFQAEAIAKHIKYVVGMSQSISDGAAIEFAVGFYTALGAGESIEFAYNLGCNAIQLEGISESLTPVLYGREKEDENEKTKRTKYVVVLSATIDEIDKPLLETIVAHLRQISGDTFLTLQRIESGSLRLILEGSQEGFEHLRKIFEQSKADGSVIQVSGLDVLNISLFSSEEGANLEELYALLEEAKESALLQLRNFAQREDFAIQMSSTFGEGNDYSSLQTAFISSSFNDFPTIEIRSSDDMLGAIAAYTVLSNTIYFSEDFLVQCTNNSQVLMSVFLEELGHCMDSLINKTDTPGDEGEIFSNLVRQSSSSNSQANSV